MEKWGRKMRTGYKIGVIAGLVMASGAAQAAPATSTFGVSLTLQAECLISATSTLAFGTLGVLVVDNDQTTTFKVQCTNSTPYSVGLNEGTTAGGDTTTRKMTKGGGVTVDYKLLTDTNRTANWGNDVTGIGQTGNGALQTYTVYGRIPAQTTPAPGSYSDTVTITVTY
jgi:spore coat protein U-like protein